VRISWTIKCLILLMHGATMKSLLKLVLHHSKYILMLTEVKKGVQYVNLQ